jgi:hypothetical protein
VTGKRIAIAVAAVLAVTLVAVAARNVYTALQGTDREDPVAAPAPPPPADAPLSAEQVKTIESTLEKVAGEASAQAALSGGVDQPWKTERSMKEYQACLQRLEGNPDLVAEDSPDARERLCLCVARSMQKAFPGVPPEAKKSRRQREYSRVELSAIEQCAGGAR